MGIGEVGKGMGEWYKRWYEVEVEGGREMEGVMGWKEGMVEVRVGVVKGGEEVVVGKGG